VCRRLGRCDLYPLQYVYITAACLSPYSTDNFWLVAQFSASSVADKATSGRSGVFAPYMAGRGVERMTLWQGSADCGV